MLLIILNIVLLPKRSFKYLSTKNCKPIDATAIVDISETGETVLDVSSLTDSYYVYIFSYTANTKFSYSVDEVWYE